jgi:hypothetical protein
MSFIKKIWHAFLIFMLAISLSYFLLFLFFHPLNLVFFVSDRLIAATGVGDSATVPENPINRLALQLDEKQRQLDQKEQDLNGREADLAAQKDFWNNGLLWAIFIAIGILGFLVILNFYFDRRREKELEILAERETQEAMPKEEKDGF